MDLFAQYPQTPVGEFSDDLTPIGKRKEAALASRVLVTFLADWHVDTGFKFRP